MRLKELRALGLSLLLLAPLACSNIQFSDAEKGLFFTAQDVNESSDTSFPLGQGLGKESGIAFIDGTGKLEYDYETPEGAKSFLFIQGRVEWYPRNEVKASYERDRDAFLKHPDLRLQNHHDFLDWGDEHYHGFILNPKKKPIGNFLIVRKGHMVYHYAIEGMIFSDKKIFRQFILPRLEKAAQYRPGRWGSPAAEMAIKEDAKKPKESPEAGKEVRGKAIKRP